MNDQKNIGDIFLLLGCLSLTGAGIFYYLTKKKKCEEGQTKCVGTDLYQCQNGEWVLIERNSPHCGFLECTTEGQTVCVGTDLYKCVNGIWILHKRNAYECGGTSYTHKECRIDEHGLVRCMEVEGIGVDTCNIDSDCPCTTDSQCVSIPGLEYHCIERECLPRLTQEILWSNYSNPPIEFEKSLKRSCFLWMSGYIKVKRAPWQFDFPLIFPVGVWSYFKDRNGVEHEYKIWEGWATIFWTYCRLNINLSTINPVPIEKIKVRVPPNGRIVEVALVVF